MFKDFMSKAKKKIDEIELDKVEVLAKKGKKVVRDKMKEHGVENYVNIAKEEAKIFSEAVSTSAKAVYEENKEILEKPVSMASDVKNKVSEYSEELKWAGGIAATFVMPVTTLVATTAIFILSDDDYDDSDLSDKEKEELEKHDVMKASSSMVEVVINKKDNAVAGRIIAGSNKNKTFEEIGLDNMKELVALIPKLEINDEEKNKTSTLIKGWIAWKEKQESDVEKSSK